MSKKQIFVTLIIFVAFIIVSLVLVLRLKPQRKPEHTMTDITRISSPMNQDDSGEDEIPISDEVPVVIISDVDTTEWEIYRNEKLGFEVKYPSGWYHRQNGYQFTPFPLEANNDVGIFVYKSEIENVAGLDY